MKTLAKGLLLGLVTFGGVLSLSAQTIVQFNFNTTTSDTTILTASTLDGNLSSSLFSVSDGSFTDTTSTTGTPPDGNAIREAGSWNAVSPTKYFSFTITPDVGQELSITGISFEYRQTASGALNYQVDVGGNTNVASGTFTRDSTWRSVNDSVTLSGITSATEIRIYGFNGGTGSFSIDTVTLTGSVSAVPEPSSFAALVGLGVLGFAGLRRRHQRTA